MSAVKYRARCLYKHNPIWIILNVHYFWKLRRWNLSFILSYHYYLEFFFEVPKKSCNNKRFVEISRKVELPCHIWPSGVSRSCWCQHSKLTLQYFYEFEVKCSMRVCKTSHSSEGVRELQAEQNWTADLNWFLQDTGLASSYQLMKFSAQFYFRC